MFKEFYKKYKNDIKGCFIDIKNGNIKNQIPNMFTASRLFAPLFIIPAAFSGNMTLVVLFTILFEMTDALDGFAARKLNVVSEFGKDLDPIVDKIFATIMSIPVIAFNPIMTLNVLFEGVIAVINTKSKIKGNVPRTTVLGKFKTLLMSLSLVVAYLSIASSAINPTILNTVLTSTLLVQIATAKQYKQIDKEKDLSKKEEIKDFETEKKEVEETTMEKVKRYSRANEISELKQLKEELLNKDKQNNKEKIKIKNKTNH